MATGQAHLRGLAGWSLVHSFLDARGKRCIDLGTGTGVVGILAVWAGCREVAMTEVLHNLRAPLRGGVDTLAQVDP